MREGGGDRLGRDCRHARPRQWDGQLGAVLQRHLNNGKKNQRPIKKFIGKECNMVVFNLSANAITLRNGMPQAPFRRRLEFE